MSSFVNSVEKAKISLRELFEPTPLQFNNYLSKKYNAEIFLKREDLSPVRSYKIRGAFNFMRKALEKNSKINEFACASAGNHAQGVAYACKHFNVTGTIFMPVTTPQQKINKTISFGSKNINIKLVGDYFDQTLKSAEEYSKNKSIIFLPPFDHSDVIEGQATVMSELIQQFSKIGNPDLISLAVGGGGLSSGMMKYVKNIDLDIDFKFVEPVGASSLRAALKAGKEIALSKINNFVDGAAVAKIGKTNFETLKEVDLETVYCAPEDRVCSTIIEMLNFEGLVLEPAGALSIDVLKDLPKDEIKGKKIVCIVSGGNFDFERLPDVKERAMRYSGFKKYLILRLPQRPGALKDFLSLLGPDDDITRFEYLKKSARNFGSVLIGIETKRTPDFQKLFEKINEAGFIYQDITDNEELKEFIL